MIYFAHIPKAGGESIKALFYEAFGFHNCLKVWDETFGGDVSAENFPSFNSEDFKAYPAIIGHLPYRDFCRNVNANELLQKGDIKIVTTVRDPIDRIISLFNFMRVNERHPQHKLMLQTEPWDFIGIQKANFQIDFLTREGALSVDDVSEKINILPIKAAMGIVQKMLEKETGRTLSMIEPKNVTAERNTKQIPLFKRELLTHEQELFLRDKHALDFELIGL
jgi:hypothetical protein